MAIMIVLVPHEPPAEPGAIHVPMVAKKAARRGGPLGPLASGKIHCGGKPLLCGLAACNP